jgi:hypothetical protein
MEIEMKIGGRNYGYGHQFGWSARQALIDYYGDGHYGTIAAHCDRFKRYIEFSRPFDIRDARDVSLLSVQNYGQHLTDLIADDEMKVSYGQNLLSTINVIMKCFRGDRKIFICPSLTVGKRCHIRTAIPLYMSVVDVRLHVQRMDEIKEREVAAIIQLGRFLGLRFRECSLLDAGKALREAARKSVVSIVRGTKGGRPRKILILSDMQKEVLGFAAEVQGKRRCLIPEHMRYDQWRNFAYGRLYKNGLRHIHDLRAAFACDRYLSEVGIIAPVLASEKTRRPSQNEDNRARAIVSKELGHNRLDVLNAYIGSWHS